MSPACSDRRDKLAEGASEDGFHPSPSAQGEEADKPSLRPPLVAYPPSRLSTICQALPFSERNRPWRHQAATDKQLQLISCETGVPIQDLASWAKERSMAGIDGSQRAKEQASDKEGSDGERSGSSSPRDETPDRASSSVTLFSEGRAPSDIDGLSKGGVAQPKRLMRGELDL